MVEDVEKIRSRLKRKPLPDLELPSQRQIDIRGAGSTQSISSQIALHRRAGFGESRSIDFLSTGYVRICNPEGYPGNQIRTRSAGSSRQKLTERGGVQSGDHIHRDTLRA